MRVIRVRLYGSCMVIIVRSLCWILIVEYGFFEFIVLSIILSIGILRR